MNQRCLPAANIRQGSPYKRNDADEFGDHRGHQASIEYAKLRMNMRLATRAIRQNRALGSKPFLSRDPLNWSQAHRVRPAPLAHGQRAAPGRACPGRGGLHQRQAPRTTRRAHPPAGGRHPATGGRVHVKEE